jgi:predicted flap endonuclease-1-like 5' DNA nuclease
MANRKIEDIEGIGAVMGEKFRAAGVKDTDSLLQNALTPKQRKELAEKTGLSEARILKFANMADLYRISGVGSEYSELLEAAGVDTVPELAKRNAANLTQAMATVNQEKKLTRQVPTESEVTKWIEQAKGLPRMIEY